VPDDTPAGTLFGKNADRPVAEVRAPLDPLGPLESEFRAGADAVAGHPEHQEQFTRRAGRRPGAAVARLTKERDAHF
jgi:hypothetical protein